MDQFVIKALETKDFIPKRIENLMLEIFEKNIDFL